MGPSKMLRKLAKGKRVCGCHRHHKPPVPWGKGDRRQARAAEKQKFKREMDD